MYLETMLYWRRSHHAVLTTLRDMWLLLYAVLYSLILTVRTAISRLHLRVKHIIVGYILDDKQYERKIYQVMVLWCVAFSTHRSIISEKEKWVKFQFIL